MTNTAIIVNDVSKTFKIGKNRSISSIGKENQNQKNILRALEGVTFTVTKGEVLGIIGLNGSGKTTLLRIIAGVYTPDSGNVQVNGRLSPLLQLGTGFQGDLNAKENIILNGMLLGQTKSSIEKKVNSIMRYAELEDFTNMKLKNFSTGMRARLAFSTAMQIDPEILLIDEILSVGDKDFQQKSYDSFVSLTKSNKTVVHASHNLQKLEEFSDRLLLLHKGHVIKIGRPEEVISKYMEMKPTS